MFQYLQWTITSDKCKKTTFIKTVIGDVVVILVMCCSITTVPVAFYLACSDDTVHYKSDKMANFCGFRCATKSPITVFIKCRFFTFIFAVFYFPVCRS